MPVPYADGAALRWGGKPGGPSHVESLGFAGGDDSGDGTVTRKLIQRLASDCADPVELHSCGEVVGGVAAFCGALAYAELGATIPRSGGEYTFLSRIYHPGAGFVSGWISATIGFAAPTALAAITFGAYLSSVVPQLPETGLAVALVVALTGVPATTHRNSSALQSGFTTLKIILIVGFCCAAVLVTPDPQ